MFSEIVILSFTIHLWELQISEHASRMHLSSSEATLLYANTFSELQWDQRSIVPDTFKFREMRGAVGGPRQPIKPYVSVAQMSVLPIESWMSRASSGQMPMSALGKKLPTCGAKLNKNRDVCLSRDRAAGAGWKAVGL